LKNIILYLSLVILFSSCSHNQKTPLNKGEKRISQWINPVFYNNDFEDELNFPLWFDDSLIRAHEIYKITKRVYPRINGDKNEINSVKQAVPKEKIEYYFDPNGLIDQIVIYSYYDDREISRSHFVYEGNMYASGYRKLVALPIILLQKDKKDEFTTELYADKKIKYSLYDFQKRTTKFKAYLNVNHGNNFFVINHKKYWGPLSVDSILHPKKEDWVILGSVRKPYKKFHVENIVNESNVYSYNYTKSSVLIRVIKKDYPFEYRRTFLYDKNNLWSSYVDSTFSDGNFISKIDNTIVYDKFLRPIEINHKTNFKENNTYYFTEKLSYRTKNKNF
jgi:hypothetical protein